MFWRFTTDWLKKGFNATTFVFFRALNWISPTLAAKAEIGFLYAKNYVMSFFAERREARLKGDIESLQNRYEMLEGDFRKMAIERGAFYLKINELEKNNGILRLHNKSLSDRNRHLEEMFIGNENETKLLRSQITRLQSLYKISEDGQKQYLDQVASQKQTIHSLENVALNRSGGENLGDAGANSNDAFQATRSSLSQEGSAAMDRLIETFTREGINGDTFR